MLLWIGNTHLFCQACINSDAIRKIASISSRWYIYIYIYSTWWVAKWSPTSILHHIHIQREGFDTLVLKVEWMTLERLEWLASQHVHYGLYCGRHQRNKITLVPLFIHFLLIICISTLYNCCAPKYCCETVNWTPWSSITKNIGHKTLTMASIMTYLIGPMRAYSCAPGT